MIDHLSPCDVQTTGDCTCTNGVDPERLRASIAEHYSIYRYHEEASRNVWVCTSMDCGYWHAMFSGAVDHLAEKIAPDVTGGAGAANGAQVAPLDDETKQDA